jgi:hypothetical protein
MVLILMGVTAMPTTECPWCAGELVTDATVSHVSCSACSITVELAADPVGPVEPALDRAA